MESVIKKLDSGIIKGILYLPEDKATMKHVRSVVFDIWEKAEDFNNRIFWIYKAKPNNGKTIKDVLTDLLASDVVTKDDIIIAQAGTIGEMNPISSVDKGLEFIDNEKTILRECNFVNTIFNRKASKSYGNADVFMNKNEACTSFLDKNVGNDKLINRFK